MISLYISTCKLSDISSLQGCRVFCLTYSEAKYESLSAAAEQEPSDQTTKQQENSIIWTLHRAVSLQNRQLSQVALLSFQQLRFSK